MVEIHVGELDQLALVALFCAALAKVFAVHVAIAVSGLLIGCLICHRLNERVYWRRQGVPGPVASLVPVHQFVLLWYKRTKAQSNPAIDMQKENCRKYGKSYGSINFLFGRREFVTTDLDIVRQVFVKQFGHFSNRWNPGSEKASSDGGSIFANMVTDLRGADWKRVRNCITPAFTSGKLKKLIPVLRDSSERLCAEIETQFIPHNKELPLKFLFAQLVLDEIGRAGYSLDINAFDKQQESHFMRTLLLGFEKGEETMRLPWMAMFPLLSSVCTMLGLGVGGMFDRKGGQFWEDLMSSLYEQRRADPAAKEKYADILQLLMEAAEEGERESADSDALGGAKQRYLSRIELLAQGFILFAAGFGTTASTMQFVIFMLAQCPQVQERLRAEIEEVLAGEELVEYEHLRRMHYLQAVVQETLRMYPVAAMTNRECVEDTLVNGIAFRRGDLVTLPVHVLHHSEQHYPEPEQFEPERFMPDQKQRRDPLAHVPFGLGPRNCVGMRLAEFQMHMALATLVRRFRFRPTPQSPTLPLKLNFNFVLTSAVPLQVLAEKV